MIHIIFLPLLPKAGRKRHVVKYVSFGTASRKGFRTFVIGLATAVDEHAGVLHARSLIGVLACITLAPPDVEATACMWNHKMHWDHMILLTIYRIILFTTV